MTTPRSTTTLVNSAAFVLVVVALYFGKPVLMPLALATLLTFLLNPVVSRLCRSGLRQSFSVALVVILGFSLLGVMIWGFGTQMTALVKELPDYKQNIREKILDLRNAGSGSSLERVRQTWRELRGEIRKIGDGKTNDAPRNADTDTASVTNAAPPEREPVPVVLRGQPSQTLWTIPTALGPLAEVAATAAFVLVLVIFMLLRGRELRNRLILFFGQSRIPTTTRALDEAAERISRYLLMQTIINSSYGIALGVTLYFIGLPYALMWGFLAAVLRFIPYVGPLFGAAMPILLSLAVFPGWHYPIIILGLVLVFEFISNMFMEPMLYGSTVGVSEVALIMAVAFWTWIWGPIGLVLATPLTVCLVVLGKHVPSLSFLPLLMGDEPVMAPPVQFYQRLLAMDEVEATEIAKKFQSEHELIVFYDQLLVPALVSAKRDYKIRELSDELLEFIVETIEKIINRSAPEGRSNFKGDAVTVLGIPVEDTIDELFLLMLSHALPESVQLRTVSSQALTGELIEDLDNNTPALVCIGTALSTGGEMRYLAKQLRSKFPTVPVVLARWGLTHAKRQKELAASAGVAEVATSLNEARNVLIQFARLTPDHRRAESALEPATLN